MNKNKCDKEANLAILNEEIQKINDDHRFYPKTEIDQIKKSSKNVILLNGKYGSGKSTVIKSIPIDKGDSIITLSMLEDDLRYLKFNIYRKIKKGNNWFQKSKYFLKNWWLVIIILLSWIIFIITQILLVSDILTSYAKTFNLLSLVGNFISLHFLLNSVKTQYWKKYDPIQKEYVLYDIDEKIIKQMKKKNIIIALEDIDRLKDEEIKNVISLLNSLILKMHEEMNNIKSKLILALDLNNISEANYSLLIKYNHIAINNTVYTNLSLITLFRPHLEKYINVNDTSVDIVDNFPLVLTIREIKKIIKDSIDDFCFFKRSKILDAYYKNFTSFNFFLLKNLLLFLFSKENISNKKIKFLFEKDDASKNYNNFKKRNFFDEHKDKIFKELQPRLQEMILNRIIPIGEKDIIPYIFEWNIDLCLQENNLKTFLEFINKNYHALYSPGANYIRIILKNKLLNLTRDFTDFDSIYKNLIIDIKKSFNDTALISNFIAVFKEIFNTNDNKLTGIDLHIKNRFTLYSNGDYLFSTQVICQKIILKIDKAKYLKYLNEVIETKKVIYIDWENKELQKILADQNRFNYDLNKKFWLFLAKIMFESNLEEDIKVILKLLAAEESLTELKPQFIEIFNAKIWGIFIDSIVKLFYLDPPKFSFGRDIYNEINNIIVTQRTKITYPQENMNINSYSESLFYLLKPWYFLIKQSDWIIENFNHKFLSENKIKSIYEDIISNWNKLHEKYQKQLKEKVALIDDKLKIKFNKNWPWES